MTMEPSSPSSDPLIKLLESVKKPRGESLIELYPAFQREGISFPMLVHGLVEKEVLQKAFGMKAGTVVKLRSAASKHSSNVAVPGVSDGLIEWMRPKLKKEEVTPAIIMSGECGTVDELLEGFGMTVGDNIILKYHGPQCLFTSDELLSTQLVSSGFVGQCYNTLDEEEVTLEMVSSGEFSKQDLKDLGMTVGAIAVLLHATNLLDNPCDATMGDLDSALSTLQENVDKSLRRSAIGKTTKKKRIEGAAFGSSGRQPKKSRADDKGMSNKSSTAPFVDDTNKENGNLNGSFSSKRVASIFTGNLSATQVAASMASSENHQGPTLRNVQEPSSPNVAEKAKKPRDDDSDVVAPPVEKRQKINATSTVEIQTSILLETSPEILKNVYSFLPLKEALALRLVHRHFKNDSGHVFRYSYIMNQGDLKSRGFYDLACRKYLQKQLYALCNLRCIEDLRAVLRNETLSDHFVQNYLEKFLCYSDTDNGPGVSVLLQDGRCHVGVEMLEMLLRRGVERESNFTAMTAVLQQDERVKEGVQMCGTCGINIGCYLCANQNVCVENNESKHCGSCIINEKQFCFTCDEWFCTACREEGKYDSCEKCNETECRQCISGDSDLDPSLEWCGDCGRLCVEHALRTIIGTTAILVIV